MMYVGDQSHLTILQMADEYPYALQRKGAFTWSTIYLEKKNYEPNCMGPFDGYIRSRRESARRKLRTIATRNVKARRYHVQQLIGRPWAPPCVWDPMECYNSLPLAKTMARKETEWLGRDHVRIWDHLTATDIRDYAP
ncbi:MAG: hypothetical protein ISN29_05045 [Gammaproteobacteria bacterium AqS3]|nr:hypothetical protein [Gammaproteobacteria bacterium AqS3]